MNEPRFILKPWEFSGANFSPAPHAVAEHEGEQFWLKARENRVFFRRADDEKRIWALTEEFEGGDLEAFWLQEMAARRMGRFVWTYRGFRGMKGHTVLCAIIGDDRRGIAREWCGGDWVPLAFPLPSRDVPSIWAPDWEAKGLNSVFSAMTDHFVFRLMAHQERETLPQRWGKGNEETLRFLAQRLLKAAGDVGTFHARRFPLVSCGAASPLGPPTCKIRWLRGSRRRLWERFLNEHFVVTGVNWSGHQPGFFAPDFREVGPERRAHWCCSPAGDSIRLDQDATVSAHDKLEALLELRDWLRGKIPDAEIERLLAL